MGIYGDSLMSHAMVLTGVTVDDNGQQPQMNGDAATGDEDKKEVVVGDVKKWRGENSWGEDRNAKGYIMMTNDWFKEFVFEIVVDKKFCSQEILDVFQIEPKVLPAWDPMGALARN